MDRPRRRLTLGRLMVGVGVCALFLCWARPLFPLIVARSPVALVALIPVGVMVLAISMSRAVDLYVKRVEREREAEMMAKERPSEEAR